MNFDPPVQKPKIPDIVRIVLHQVTKLRAEGKIAQPSFDLKLLRLAKEELEPRGLSLLVRELADGHTRFLIKNRTGIVCDMIDCVAEGCHSIDLSDETSPVEMKAAS